MSEQTFPDVGKKVLIRNCSLQEMPLLFQLSSYDARNPGLNDSDLLYNLDPDGFYIALEDENRLIGSISAINIDETLGFIGLHFIIPEFRHTGVEDKLLELALEKIGNRNAGINCTENEVEYYSNHGFKTSHRIFTYEGVANSETLSFENIVSPFKHPFEYLGDIDKEFYGCNRKHFLPQLLQQPQSLLLAELDGKKYSGYGLYSPCQNGIRIGPLLSRNEVTAEHLLISLVGCISHGIKYFLDVPEPNEKAISLAENRGMKKIKETFRMYLKEDTTALLNNIYSFTNYELG